MLNESKNAKHDYLKKDYYGMLFNIWDIFYGTDEVAHACYAGVEEMTLTYQQNWTNSSTSVINTSLLVNTAYHFGDIYDDIEALYFFFFETPFSPGTTTGEAGNHAGEIIYNIRTPPVPVEKANFSA